MELKAVNTLCLLVHFLINKSQGFCQQVSPSPQILAECIEANCCATNTTNHNESVTYMLNGKTVLNGSLVHSPKGATNCWYVEMTIKTCNERQTTTTSNRIKATNEKDISLKENDKVSCTGVVVGAVLGGAVFGGSMTVIVFLYLCQKLLLPKQRNLDCTPAGDENLQESLGPVDNETVYNEISDLAVMGVQPKGNGNISRENQTILTGYRKPITATDDGSRKIQSDDYFIIEPHINNTTF